MHSRFQTSQGISLAPVVTKEKRVLRAKDEIIVRRKPSIQSPTTTVLQEHAAAEVLAEDDAWYEIRTPTGEIGWVDKD